MQYLRKIFSGKVRVCVVRQRGLLLCLLGAERVIDNVMILGLCDMELMRYGISKKILSTKHKFGYGKEEGCW